MRIVETAVIGVLAAGSALGQASTGPTTSAKQHHTTVHNAATHHTGATHHTAAAHHAATPADPKATEGLAAIGSMSEAKGPSTPMYTLRYVDLVPGTGDPVKVPGYVTVKYTGWTTDGKKFDSSDDHPGQEPITFLVGARRVIAGWDTGFEGMRVGGKRRLIIPWQLAYGEEGRPPVIPPKADLIFDIEVVGESDTPPNPFAHAMPARPQTPQGTSSQPSGSSVPTGATGTAQPSSEPAAQPSSEPKSQPGSQTAPQTKPQN